MNDPETDRLVEDDQRKKNWKRWGPYLSDRQWGTVREDYSANGDCWDYFTHDESRSRAYRWGEDGLLGITDRECRLCFAISLWNDRDPILKERLFGLTNPQGNHGEDVKENYYFLDSTPTHSYMRALYKYPQAAYPYDDLVRTNAARSKDQREYELEDTGVFNDGRYFDVTAEYAKSSPNDILIKITVANRGPDAAVLHVLPTLWFRNIWSWGRPDDSGDGSGGPSHPVPSGDGDNPKPRLTKTGPASMTANHPTLGGFRFDAEILGGKKADGGDAPQLLFTENDSDVKKLFDAENYTPYVKDAFHAFVISGRAEGVNPANVGTKAAAYYALDMPPGAETTLRMRLYGNDVAPAKSFGPDFDAVFAKRIAEADEFYDRHIPTELPDQERLVARQAFAGLMWAKQFYHYVVKTWLRGDPDQPAPPKARRSGRNADWKHVFARDVLSMPDSWEYPWFAAWDLAFHTVCFAKVDPTFAKDQLQLLLREWYMHPNGELPAYEFGFGDVNPPVHAWACWRVYKMTGPQGDRDRLFLERTFQKLLMNFTWWVNRKDPSGKNVFSGGFLGLDNIGVFDRSQPLPTGGQLEQADGTAWMAFYCSTMLAMALELATTQPAYEDIASKFFEHFIAIIDATNTLGKTGLWDDADGFYYDQIWQNGVATPLKVRSLVGLIPLIAVENLPFETVDQLKGFAKRTQWFVEHRPDLAEFLARCDAKPKPDESDTHIDRGYAGYLLALPTKDRLLKVLAYMLDENEFLSPHGLRSVSKVHKDHPYVYKTDGREWRVEYEPAESRSSLFGGNSNWRGPVWFPINFLIIEALERYHHFYGEGLKVDFPTGSGNKLTLQQVAHELTVRLVSLFLPDENGNRPCYGGDTRYRDDPHWKDLVLFNEYFDGDDGRGCGASHQTGWTALVGRMITGLKGDDVVHRAGERRERPGDRRETAGDRRDKAAAAAGT